MALPNSPFHASLSLSNSVRGPGGQVYPAIAMLSLWGAGAAAVVHLAHLRLGAFLEVRTDEPTLWIVQAQCLALVPRRRNEVLRRLHDRAEAAPDAQRLHLGGR